MEYAVEMNTILILRFQSVMLFVEHIFSFHLKNMILLFQNLESYDQIMQFIQSYETGGC